MNAKEPKMILSLTKRGNSVCLVMKLSKKPAIRRRGMVVIKILMLLSPLRFNDSDLEKVLGNTHPIPRAKEAAPLMMRAEISNVP